MTDLFKTERKKNQVAKCEKCGKEFWTGWHIEKKDMKVCGPCYFKNK